MTRNNSSRQPDKSVASTQADAAQPAPASAGSRVTDLLTSYWAAALVLAVFVFVMIAAVKDKSTTYDEIAHLTAGRMYWAYDDYRLNPENGNLPQRVMALPLLFGSWRLPETNTPLWQHSNEWLLGHQFFYGLGNDLWTMLLLGRSANTVFALALGLVVYTWSRRLFGRSGGMLSLLAYVLCPTVLANGALMTSDLAGSLFFLAAMWAIWSMLHNLTFRTVALTGLAVAGLALSKMSAIVVAPIALVLLSARVAKNDPLPVKLWGAPRVISNRSGQALWLVGGLAAQLVIVVAMVWFFYGFRYSMFNHATGAETPDRPWEMVLNQHDADGGTPFVIRAIELARAAKILPEAFIYGHAHVYMRSRGTPAFLDGQVGLYGWTSFFPLTFLYKTPLALMGLVVLAAIGAVLAWRAAVRAGKGKFLGQAIGGLYRTLPLWLLIVAYLATIIPSRFNIGHRHILPIYAPMIVLCGAAVYWFRSTSRLLRALPALLIVLLAVEMSWMFPNYLCYFNQIAGGPSNGYRHLVDSSLDWGQDLPALKDYLRARGLGGPDKPVYYAYFGTGSPIYYGIPGRYIAGNPGYDRPPVIVGGEPLAAMGPGTYCISASMLQPILLEAMGDWCPRYEEIYQATGRAISEFVKTNGEQALVDFWRSNPAELQQVMGAAYTLLRIDRPRLQQAFAQLGRDIRVIAAVHDYLRVARLMAFLRQRCPDDNVNYSILIYNLSAQDVQQAFFGSPPPFGQDVMDLARKSRAD